MLVLLTSCLATGIIRCITNECLFYFGFAWSFAVLFVFEKRRKWERTVPGVQGCGVKGMCELHSQDLERSLFFPVATKSRVMLE